LKQIVENSIEEVDAKLNKKKYSENNLIMDVYNTDGEICQCFYLYNNNLHKKGVGKVWLMCTR
jgi:hypothetical protein